MREHRSSRPKAALDEKNNTMSFLSYFIIALCIQVCSSCERESSVV